jgi:small GTP-binding protein
MTETQKIKPDCIIKIIIIGDSSVGKSSITTRYVSNIYEPTSMLQTLGIDVQLKNILYKDINVQLQLWDTAGQERFKSIAKNYYRGSEGVVYVYDVTNIQTFYNVENWLNYVTFSTNTRPVCILVGNKIDLINDTNNIKRSVSVNQGKELARKHNMMFIETSALTGDNVNELFDTLNKAILNKLNLFTDEKYLDPYGITQLHGSTELKGPVWVRGPTQLKGRTNIDYDKSGCC